MPFLPPSQQHQSTEGIADSSIDCLSIQVNLAADFSCSTEVTPEWLSVKADDLYAPTE